MCEKISHLRVCLEHVAGLSRVAASLASDDNHNVFKRFSDQEFIIKLDSGFPILRLNYREAQCALLFLLGFTAKESAMKIGISSRTIEHYLLLIKRRFHVKTRSEFTLVLLQSDFVVNMYRLISG